MRLGLLATAAVAMLACDSAPSDPTWRSDVKDIVLANCIKCHGRVARGGAPARARFDRYSFAGGFAGSMANRASGEAEFQMPPEIRMSDVQIDTLRNWADNGAPLGDPDPDNQPPEIESEGFAGDEATVTLPYLITDGDFDLVFGTLTATPVGGGDAIIITEDLHSGVGEVEWFIAAVQTGEYEISALIDDDNQEREVDLGNFTVARADANTAPTLSIQAPVAPVPGTRIGGDALTIDFTIEDPDVGDLADVEFTLVRGDETIPVTTVVDAPIGPNSVVADISSAPEGPGFTLVATSGLSMTSAGPFTIDHGGN